MTNKFAPQLRRAASAAVVGLLVGGATVTPAVAQEATCGAKLTDWVDPTGVTTYVGSMATGKKAPTAYKIVFTADRVTSTATEESAPEVKEVPYRLSPGPRLAWEDPRDLPAADKIQFELKRPMCAGGGTVVTRAVAAVAVPDRDSDTSFGPYYCESAYRVGKGKQDPPKPARGVCAPGEL